MGERSAAGAQREAAAVTANPLGTRIPAAPSLLIISPSEAFFPPTEGMSRLPVSASHRMRGAVFFTGRMGRLVLRAFGQALFSPWVRSPCWRMEFLSS